MKEPRGINFRDSELSTAPPCTGHFIDGPPDAWKSLCTSPQLVLADTWDLMSCWVCSYKFSILVGHFMRLLVSGVGYFASSVWCRILRSTLHGLLYPIHYWAETVRMASTSLGPQNGGTCDACLALLLPTGVPGASQTRSTSSCCS